MVKASPFFLAALAAASWNGVGAWAADERTSCVVEKIQWFSAQERPPKEASVSTKNIYVEGIQTVSGLMRKRQIGLQAALEALKVPKMARQYFDSEGKFRYRPPQPIQLSLENGDEALRVLRIQFTEPEIFDSVLKDCVRVLKEDPALKVSVVMRPKNLTDFQNAVRRVAAPEVASRIKPLPVESEKPLTLWGQDGSKPISGGSHSMQTLVPQSYSSVGLKSMWKALRGMGWPTWPSLFSFEGGDLVVGAKHVFVGPDVVNKAMKKYSISRGEALSGLQAEFGKPVFEIGKTERQSEARKRSVSMDRVRSRLQRIDFHLDLFMAVARNKKTGRETVLLQSPELALQLLSHGTPQSQLPKDWDALCDQLMKGKTGSTEKDLLRLLKQTGEASFRRQQDYVNGVAAQLRAIGYDVRFLPGLAEEDGFRLGLHLQIFSYANLILSHDYAILPELDIPVLDRAAVDILSDLGYRSVQVHSPQETYCLWGGFRCVAETFRKQ